MNRRNFVIFISALFAFPSVLFGQIKHRVVGLKESTTMNIPKKFSPTAQRRTVEIVNEWFAPAGLNRQVTYLNTADFTGIAPLSIGDLHYGDLFRIREPDGTLVSLDGATVFRAASEPSCRDGKWSIEVGFQ
jgi:hypothetical protein